MGGHQMSLLATVTLAWAVIYGYVAVYSFTLRGYQPDERELSPFAISTFGMMLYALGAAALTDSGTAAAATTSYQLIMFGGSIATAGFMHFAHALAKRPTGVAVAAGYALGLVGIVLNFSGLMFDPALPATPHPMLVPGLHVLLLPTPTVAYVATAGLSLIAIVRAAWIMASSTSARDLGERFWLSVTGGALGLAAVHDAVINFLPVRSIYVLEHVYLLFALAMTHHLLGRVARTDSDLGRRTQELHDSLIDLRRTEAELTHKEQLAAVGELSAIIAQEVRSPIAVMGTALAGLHQASEGDSNRSAMLDVVDRESDRLNHLVSDLLSYAKPLHTQMARTQISDVIERALNTISPTIRQRTTVETLIAPDPSSLECDPELLHQALRNLIDNALAPMVRGGTLTIETSSCQHRGDAAVRLSITSKSDVDRSADMEHARSASGRPPGTGLGLAIVDRVVRAHQGHVEIRSADGGASAFVLTLPIRAEGAEPVTPSMLPSAPLVATVQRA